MLTASFLGQTEALQVFSFGIVLLGDMEMGIPLLGYRICRGNKENVLFF